MHLMDGVLCIFDKQPSVSLLLMLNLVYHSESIRRADYNVARFSCLPVTWRHPAAYILLMNTPPSARHIEP